MGKKVFFILTSLSFIIPPSTILVTSCSSIDHNNNSSSNNLPSNNVRNQNTEIVKSLNSSKIGWDTKTKIEIYQLYQSSITTLNINSKEHLNDFVFKNISNFVKGNISLIKSSQSIEAELIPWNSIDTNINSLIIKLTIKANAWYLNNQIQNKNIVQNVQVNNLKSIPNWIDSSGGYIDNSRKLHASKYAEVLKFLNLNYLTPLHRLDNKILNQKLNTTSMFKNLTLTIQSGSSTSKGKLFLNLQGTYELNSIQIKINSQITITGFFIVKNNLQLALQNIELNYTNWFQDQKPILEDNSILDQINNISKDEWLNKYINAFVVYNNLNSWTQKNFFNFGFNFNNLKANVNNITKKISFSFEGTYTNKKYDGNTWINETTIQWNQSNLNLNNATMNIPDTNDLEKWLISYMEIDTNKLIKHYPSYYLGIQSLSESINDGTYYPFMEYLTEKSNKTLLAIQKRYFLKTQIAINLSKDVIANDFDNILSFSLFLQVGDESSIKHTKQFSFNNIFTKVLSDNLPKDNVVTIKSSIKEKNSWFSHILKYLKINHNVLIDKLFINKENKSLMIKEENQQKVILPIIKSPLINNADWPNQSENANNNFKKISSHIVPKIFNQELKLVINDRSYPPQINQGVFNYESKLFNLTNNFSNAFYIEDARYFFDNIPLTITLSKIEDHILFSFDGKTNISFANYYNEYPTKFVMIILKSDWTSQI